MTTGYVKYPQLGHDQMTKLQALERELGTLIVAVEPQAEVARLSADKLKRLQEAEREMGVILLAYEAPSAQH